MILQRGNGFPAHVQEPAMRWRTHLTWILAASVAAALLVSPPSAAPPGGQPVCKACGEVIEGSYVSAGADSYHRRHFRCEICQRPLADSYVVRNGKNYHPECYERHLALKCDLCGGTINGRYIQNFWGHAYHWEHKGREPQCDHCSRFISQRLTGGGWEYEDGRKICGICRKSAVTTIAETRRLMREVANRLRQLGLHMNSGQVKLHLAGLDEIRGLAGSSSHELRGYTDYNAESFLGFTTRKNVDVYILYGMPRESAMATLAHELMHVWQAERGRMQNDPAFSEGSCNYAAYLVIKEETAPHARFVLQSIRNNEDEIYGEGFRRVKRFAEAEGLQAWIRLLANEDVLPSGY